MPTYPAPQETSPAHSSIPAAADQAMRRQARRSGWLKTLHQWHWISSALCLLGMLLFAITGITLNHSADIEAKPRIQTQEGQLPPVLLAQLKTQAESEPQGEAARLPVELRSWLADELDIHARDAEAEWSADEVYLALPRPGGDAWLRVDLNEGALEYEDTDRGWIAYLNDLHKGRHAGTAWSWFIDIFAAACLVFSITGLFILQMHAGNRPSTWPIVGLGVVIPVLLVILFIH
ncbi:hypothetical protein GPA19_19395 [Azoarcus indigens]|uniref:PepSY-associated transmembrane protein n=2 Tax=Azoarcus indigens TaxID=29545 RepID=A0A4R6DU52_9RHOO|nr:hypothetical protein [Azoarcus indigens]TDN48701.1 hypothetical protein C7389_11488 [Azoarcus indigens]